MVLTGTVVNHRHFATAGHTHGFGWGVLAGKSSLSGLPPIHSHFVLLGIELEAIPTLPTLSSGDGICTASGEISPGDGELREIDFTPDQVLLVSDGPAYTSISLNFDQNNSVSPPPTNCPHITGARSGVLRS